MAEAKEFNESNAESEFVEMYYFSIEKGGFYLASAMDTYLEKPDDLVEMNIEEYRNFWNCPAGYYQIFDEKGPRLELIPPPDYQAIATSERKSLLDEATQAITVWQTKLLMGRKLSDAETESLNAWMDYIDVLNDTNISDAPNIHWPIKPTA